MLYPRDLDNIGNAILPLMREMETRIIRLIAAHIQRFYQEEYHVFSFDEVSSRYQVIYEIELIKQETQERVTNEIYDLLFAAMHLSVRQENQEFLQDYSIIAETALSNMRNEISLIFSNIGMDGRPFDIAIDNAMAHAYLQREAGRPMEEALQPPFRDLMQNGVQALARQADERNLSIDGAVRSVAIRTAKVATIDISEAIANAMGYDGYLMSWHVGARPLHSRWQGRIFSRFPGHSRYEWYETGVNIPDGGLSAPNCRHSRMPIPLGRVDEYLPYSSPIDRSLWNQLDAPKYFEGRRLYPHEAEAMMRRFETETRRNTREKIAMQAIGYTLRVAELDALINRRLKRYIKLSEIFSISTQMDRFWTI